MISPHPLLQARWRRCQGAAWLWLLAWGCGQHADSAKLRQDVLAADPQFASVLEKRDQVADRVALLEREFSVKKIQIEGQIAQLRQELAQARRQVDQKTRQAKAQLDVDRERLTLAISIASEALKSKEQQRASVGRSVSRLAKALKNPQQEWTKSERANLERELAELLHDAQRIDLELSGLKAHLQLLTDKRTLLNL